MAQVGGCDINANIWDIEETGSECEVNQFYRLRGSSV